MKRSGIGMGILVSLTVVLMSTTALARSAAFKDNIYDPGYLKPVDSALRVRVGEPAPDFTLPAITGERITLSRFRAGKMWYSPLSRRRGPR